MTREQISAFLARHQESLDRRDVDALTRNYSEDCVLETPSAGTVKGRAAVEKVYRGILSSFPDLAFDHTEFVIDGDRVVQITTMTGTNKGGFMNMPPTGKKVRFPLVIIFALKDGQIVAEQRVYDFTGLLVQAGVLKAKPL